MRMLLAVPLALAIAACGETTQDAGKSYAGKEDTKSYAGDTFKGDKQKYEQSLAKRADYQNEYVRTGDAKTK